MLVLYANRGFKHSLKPITRYREVALFGPSCIPSMRNYEEDKSTEKAATCTCRISAELVQVPRPRIMLKHKAGLLAIAVPKAH